MQPVLLENLAWPEIATLREQNGGLLLLPLGATEQHGPHLPVGMDTLLAEAVCHAASERTGVPVMSAIRYTVSQGHTPKWPGTFSLSHETFIAALRDIAAWAVATGWKRLLLINSHFGNDAGTRRRRSIAPRPPRQFASRTDPCFSTNRNYLGRIH